MANTSLNQAKRAKQDEFYTRLEDISDELYHYRHHFQGKSVLLNCDDPEESNFWKYFELNFDDLGLTRLVSTHYHPTERTYKLVMERDENGDIITTKTPLEGNGDFRSAECIALMDEADIITTNPPFSLFREYVALLMEHDKKVLIIGNQNAITYKEVFPLLRNNQLWLGYHCGDMAFRVPDYYEARATRYWVDDTGQKWRSLGNACWFTNLDIDKRHEPLTLWKDYDPNEYPHYDNYNAIEVSKVAEIPVDYYGVMGVPITFLDKYCPEQFEILGIASGRKEFDILAHPTKRYEEAKQHTKGSDEVKNGGKVNTGAEILYSTIDECPKKTYYTAKGVSGFLHRVYNRIFIRRVDQPDKQDEGE